VNGRCDFCRQPGRLATCMCVHEHRVGVWVCSGRCSDALEEGGIGCRICDWDVAYPWRHWCTLHEVREDRRAGQRVHLATEAQQ
jgi:hypothetical protein